uniref:NADH dehydrogenase subunit 1 n=1 Tax=Egeirotrioza rufa TaxID=3132082 RepID=UPI0030FF3148
MFVDIISLFLMLIFSLVSVGFLTLMERKILGFIQIRKGPLKVGFLGIFQPFSDALKLFSSEFFFPLNSNFNLYWVSPLVMLLISMIVWLSFPYWYIVLSWKYSLIFMLIVLSMSVYPVMACGWSSNSSYSMLGCLRVIAQSVSYEVSFFLLIMTFIYMIGSMKILDYLSFQYNTWFIILIFPIFIMLLVSLLAELNRTPFDFSEGESELVSGFNIEYGGSGFAFSFLGEYLSILFSSTLIVILFLGSLNSHNLFFLKIMMVTFIIIILRGTLPRYRYDKLMNLCWKSFLSCSIFMIMFYTSLFYFKQYSVN